MKQFKRFFSTLLCTALIMGTVVTAAPSRVSAAGGKYAYESHKNLQTVIGWEGDKNAPLAYADGSFWVRDRGGLRVNFGVPDAEDITWENKEGYLPCMVSSYTKDGVAYTVENFADELTVGGSRFEVVYSRMTAKNTTTVEKALPVVSPELVPISETAKNETKVAAGESVVRDWCIATDRFGGGYPYPENDALSAAAGAWDEHYTHMKDYWNGRLAGIADIKTLPAGYEKLIEAYKAGYIYTLIVKDGTELHVGEDGYDRVFDHDVIGMLATLVELGDTADFKDYAPHILDNVQYPDARWKYAWPFALYLQKTGDTEYIGSVFETIKSNTHYIEAERQGPNGIMKLTNAIDSDSYWLIDNWAALTGLTAYKYICDALGQTEEAAWALSQYNALKTATETTLSETMAQYNHFAYLPIDMQKPNPISQRKNPLDGNWAASFMFGRWAWDGYLFGAEQEGLMLDLIDDTYSYGFYRQKNVDFEAVGYSFGGYPGFSSGYNAGYGSAALRGEEYRDQGIKSYKWMIENTMSGPYSWWENIGEPTDDYWNTTHASYGGGSCPHMWGQSVNTKVLLDSMISEKSDGTRIIGRGIPNDWIKTGERAEIDNVPVTGGKRMGYAVTTAGGGVTLTLSGDTSEPVSFELPIFVNNIASAGGLSFDNARGAVTIPAGTASATVTLISKDGYQDPDAAQKKEEQEQKFAETDAIFDYQMLMQDVQKKIDKEGYNVDSVKEYAWAGGAVAALNALKALPKELESYTPADVQNVRRLLKEFDQRLSEVRTDYGRIPAILGDIAVDAQKDALYDTAMPVKVCQYTQSGMRTGTYAQAYVTYAGGYLYCYADVIDNNVMIPTEEELKNAWDCESIDFYINPKDSNDQFDVQGFRVGCTNYPSVFAAENADINPDFYDYEGPEQTKGYIESQARLTDTGYAVEFKIPIDLTPGQQVGIQFMINDKYEREDGSVRASYIRGANVNWGDTWIDYGFATVGNPEVKKASLLQAILYAQDQQAKPGYANVIPASKAVFEDALERALACYNSADSTQGQVDTAYTQLISAVHDLGLYQGDKQELEKLIKSAEETDLSGYQPEGQEEFKAALAEAKKVFADENAIQDTVNEAAKRLELAIANLSPKADKYLLKQAIDTAEGLDLSKYVDKGKAELAIALREAKKVYGDEKATKAQVDEATKDLNAAIFALRRAANKENLAAVIKKAEALSPKDYTPESFEDVTRALGVANAMMADGSLSEDDQAQVDAAAAVLAAAVENLVKASGGTPGNPDEPDNPDTPGGPKGDNTQTGDASPLLGLSVLTLCCGAALVLCRKRKSR